MTIQTINPSTGQILKTYEELTWTETQKKLQASKTAFKQYQKTSFAERRAYLQKLADLLNARQAELAKLITTEMGKPITQAEAEIKKCIWLIEHYVTNAETYLANKNIQTESLKSYVMYQPLGTIFGIMPWNFPFWQVLRYTVPALMAGNVVLLKHAPISTGAGLMIEALFLAAGLPTGVFQTLVISNEIAAQVISDPIVKAVTLTGSGRAGSIVAAEAGRSLKKVVLELGGADPYLVLADADLNLAAKTCVTSRLNNSGQVCIAAKRLIIHKNIAEAFIQKIIVLMQAYASADPLLTTTILGPLARADLRETVHQQVQKSIAEGAQCLLGGKMPVGEGYFYPATLLTNVKPGMVTYEEEIFGPVLAVTIAQDDNQLIEFANQSNYGLSAAIFSKDLDKAEHIAQLLEVGSCRVNGLVASDPRLPFGGIKSSGFGRELGEEGIKEFVNIKTIIVE